MLERELKLIVNREMRDGVRAILEDNEEWVKTCPPSPSGKFHLHEKTMEEHIIDCVAVAEEVAKEFKIKGTDFDILISACILHDIGRIKTTCLGKTEEKGNWKYYPKTGWSQKDYGKNHPFDSSKVIKEYDFPNNDRVRDLVKCHMSHWLPWAPQPQNLLEYAMCISDYMATKIPDLNWVMEKRRESK